LNIFDSERKTIALTLGCNGKEHLADCTWKNNDIIIGRHRQQILIWDKRVNRYVNID
jgi:prophage tail gpP-like protein